MCVSPHGLVLGIAHLNGARVLGPHSFIAFDLDVLPLNLGKEDSVWPHLLHLLVQLNGLLESITLLHDLLVLHRDHAVVHVNCHVVLGWATLFLVFKASLAGTKWIHLVPLADLVTESLHLVLHQLVMEV